MVGGCHRDSARQEGCCGLGAVTVKTERSRGNEMVMLIFGFESLVWKSTRLV
jgi:hypothetical protein